MISSRKIVAVLAAYNEEKSIAKVILTTEKLVDKIIVVDDGSRDLTGDIAKRLGVAVLTHESNRGKGAALRSGIDLAKKEGFDILVTLDSDSQHDPKEIPLVVEPILQGNAGSGNWSEANGFWRHAKGENSGKQDSLTQCRTKRAEKNYTTPRAVLEHTPQAPLIKSNSSKMGWLSNPRRYSMRSTPA